METKTKVLIAIGSLSILGLSAFLGYKFWKSKKEDDLYLEIGSVDWANRIVPFKVLKDGKVIINETINWKKDNLGKEFGYINSSDKKNDVWGSNLPNGLVLVAKSLGKNKSGKIIDFNSKKVKEYYGENLVKDIESANQAIKNFII